MVNDVPHEEADAWSALLIDLEAALATWQQRAEIVKGLVGQIYKFQGQATSVPGYLGKDDLDDA